MIKQKHNMEDLLPIIKESIRDGGQFVFYPSGDSMRPTIIPEQDCVVLIEPTDIKKYDLVLFTRTGGKFVLHRIMKIKNGEYTIKGDNQNWTETTSCDAVIAKVNEIRKKDGTVLSYKKTTALSTVAKLEVKKFVRRVINKLKRIFKGEK